MLIFGYHYGVRKSSLLQFRWTWVDFFSKVIRVPGQFTKNKKVLEIPIYGEVATWLAAERKRRSKKKVVSPWMFIHKDGSRIKSYRTAWDGARRRLGADDALFHDLRRTAVSNMIQADIPEKLAMAISGHKTRSVFDRYHIVNSKHTRATGEKMDTYLKELAKQSSYGKSYGKKAKAGKS